MNQLRVRWVVRRNKRGLAQTLPAPNNQVAVLQLPEDPRGALAAAVQLILNEQAFGSRMNAFFVFSALDFLVV